MKQDLILYSTLGALSILSAGVCGFMYNKWKKIIEDLKVVYTVSEAACLDVNDKPKTLLIQGILQNKNKAKYLYYSSVVSDNKSRGEFELKDGNFVNFQRDTKIHKLWQKQCYLQDQFGTNDKILMNIDQTTQFFGDCFNYRKKQRFEQYQSMMDIFFTVLYSLFTKQIKIFCTYIEDNQIGIQFGLPVVVLADLKYDGQLLINRVQLVTAKSSQFIIQIHKNQKNFLLFFTGVLAIAGILFAVEAYDVYSKLCLEKVKREINDINKSLPFKKSISKVLTNPRDDELCLVCQTSIRSVIFQPCQHFVCCHTCYEQLEAKPDYKLCVYCRANIIKIARIVEEAIQN
ncbi:hypothetical protein pb186bvf_007985 [Paramecium bursaria]